MVLDVNCVTIIFTCSRPVLSGSLTWFGSFASERGLRSPTGPVPDEHLRLYIWSLSLKAPEIGTVNIQLFEHVLNVRIHSRPPHLCSSSACGSTISEMFEPCQVHPLWSRSQFLIFCSDSDSSCCFNNRRLSSRQVSGSLTFNHIGLVSDLVMTQL